MNKLFTKIAGATLGVAMAIGVGVAVGHAASPSRAEAATKTLSASGIGSNSVTDSQKNAWEGNGTTGSYLRLSQNQYFRTKNAITDVDTSSTITVNVHCGTYSTGTFRFSFQAFSNSGFTSEITTRYDVTPNSNGDKSYDFNGGKAISFTSSADDVYFKFWASNTGAIRFYSFSITYTQKTEAITNFRIDNSSSIGGPYEVGDSWSTSGLVTKGEIAGVDTVIDNSKITYEFDPETPNSTDITSVDVVAKYGDYTSAKKSFNVTVNPHTMSGAIPNGRYFIYNQDGALEPRQYTNGTSTKVSILTTKAWDFELVDDDTYTVSTVVDSTRYYIYTTTNNSGLRTQTDPAEWYLEDLQDGTYALSCYDGSDWRWLCGYNDSKDDWRTYKDSSTGEMYILNIVEEKEVFSTNFLGTFTKGCIAEGGYTPANIDWTKANTQYNTLSDANKLVFKNAEYTKTGTGSSTVVTPAEGVSQNVAEVVARYDLMVAKYTTSVFADFMNRNPSLSGGSRISSQINSSMNVTIVIIVATSVVSILSLGLLLAFKKKKEQ